MYWNDPICMTFGKEENYRNENRSVIARVDGKESSD